MTVNPTRHNSEIDPTESDNHSTLASDGWDTIVDNRQWTPDNPPMIADRFFRGVVPIQTTPSDKISFQTAVCELGKSVMIVGRQQEGIACRVTLLCGDVTFNGDQNLSFIISTNQNPSVTYVDISGIVLPICTDGIIYNSTGIDKLLLETRSAIWLSVVSSDPATPATVGIVLLPTIVETYDLNA